MHVALYLTYLLGWGASYITVNSTIYSIKWINNYVVYYVLRQKDYPQNPCAIVNDMLQRLCPLHKDTNDV